ncbi:unnamed protein product [Urochloa humidicola]
MQLCCTQVLGYKLDELSDWKYSGGCTQVPRCCTQIRKDQVSWSFEVAGATVRDHWKKSVLQSDTAYLLSGSSYLVE